MQLTLQYKKPDYEIIQCTHCNEQIKKEEVYKYVKWIFGDHRSNFHEECFYAVKVAIDRFYEVFIEMKDQKVN